MTFHPGRGSWVTPSRKDLHHVDQGCPYVYVSSGWVEEGHIVGISVPYLSSLPLSPLRNVPQRVNDPKRGSGPRGEEWEKTGEGKEWEEWGWIRDSLLSPR